jgi:uncharacterized protein
VPTPGTLGIHVQEETGPQQNIARAPTARTAFIGRTLRGPVNTPVPLSNFSEFQQVFGGLWQPSTLGYAVEQFFDNGGAEAIVVRVANGARAASLELRAGAQVLRLCALRPGTREYLRASVDYDNVSSDDAESFNLTVQRVRLPDGEYIEDQEIFTSVSLRRNCERFLGEMATHSALFRLFEPLPNQRPDLTVDPASGLATGYVASKPDGDDGDVITDYDIIGSAADGRGVFALDSVEGLAFLCIPPLSREQDLGPSALLVAARYCTHRRAMLIVDPPQAWRSAQEAEHGMRRWDLAVENAVMYFPRVLAHDKLRGRMEAFAPCGSVAGMLTRQDEIWPVWSAAEGDGAILRPGLRPACFVTDAERKRLAACGVNVLSSVRESTRPITSPRTLAANRAQASDGKYLSAKRLVLFILNSIERGTRWAAFAPDTPATMVAVQAQVEQFLESINEEGAFPDRTAEDAFFVICDERVNSPDAAAAREIRILLGLPAPRAGEFHGHLICHAPAGSRVEQVSLNRLHAQLLYPVDEMA